MKEEKADEIYAELFHLRTLNPLQRDWDTFLPINRFSFSAGFFLPPFSIQFTTRVSTSREKRRPTFFARQFRDLCTKSLKKSSFIFYGEFFQSAREFFLEGYEKSLDWIESKSIFATEICFVLNHTLRQKRKIRFKNGVTEKISHKSSNRVTQSMTDILLRVCLNSGLWQLKRKIRSTHKYLVLVFLLSVIRRFFRRSQ